MPYYRWQGINLQGASCAGTAFALSIKELEARLLKKDIAVIAARGTYRQWFSRSITLSDKIAFMRHLAVLLDAGLHVPQALAILSEQADPIAFQEILQGIAHEIEHGMQLPTALAQYPRVFDEFTVQMVQVGEASGHLAHSLQQTADFLEQRQHFYRQIQSASVMPVFTLIVFCLIAVIIFMVVVPKFATIFATMRKQVPPLTAYMLKVSAFMNAHWLAMTIALFVFGLLLVALVRSARGKELITMSAQQLPFIGSLIANSSLVYFLRSLSLLLDGGMHVLPALSLLLKNSSSNQVPLNILKLSVESGSSLSQAMANVPSMFPDDVQAMVKVGEESGKLSVLLSKAANQYGNKVQRLLGVITSLIQPLLMLFLGLLITALIFAVYVPIFNMAQIV